MDRFTQQGLNRDKRLWPYLHMLSDQHGKRMIETVHASESSLQMEVRASASRIAKAEPNRGGQIPAHISVDGIADSVWRGWLT